MTPTDWVTPDDQSGGCESPCSLMVKQVEGCVVVEIGGKAELIRWDEAHLLGLMLIRAAEAAEDYTPPESQQARRAKLRRAKVA